MFQSTQVSSVPVRTGQFCSGPYGTVLFRSTQVSSVPVQVYYLRFGPDVSVSSVQKKCLQFQMAQLCFGPDGIYLCSDLDGSIVFRSRWNTI